MPAIIDSKLIPEVIRESIDPEILKRARSVEWSITRDTGEDEHGFVDGSNEDFLSSKDLLYKTHGEAHHQRDRLAEKLCADTGGYSPDSGLQISPISPSMTSLAQIEKEQDDHYQYPPTGALPNVISNRTGSMKRHPMSCRRPFPIYQVNQDQLDGDVVFEPDSSAGERTVHRDRSSKVLNEQELSAMGLDSDFFGPNTRTTMDEQELEVVQTSMVRGGSRELASIYNSMRIDKDGYFDLRRTQSAAGQLNDEQSSTRRHVAFGSLDNVYSGEWEVGTEDGSDDFERYTAERIRCTILLDCPVEEIKVEPKPLQIEWKKPLFLPPAEEEKLVEDPDNLWLKMGPAQYGPPLGTMGRRKGPEEEWIGPPCELCHKQIEERRCMLAENMKFHCWHFSCSFCLKTLKPADFLVAEANNKPYCLNCHKREFPEIPLLNLKLEA